MDIISRAEWGARAPESRFTVPWSKRTGFMGHYSAASATQTPRQIQDYHMRVKGWSDIGYNFLINSVTGLLYEGRGWNVLGAHCAGHNTEAIGVCIIGKDQAGRQDVSDAARRAFKWLYEEANDRKGKRLQLLGHRDRGNTSCPGDEIYAWLHAGLPIVGRSTPAPSKPPAAGKPAPGTPITFPLPAGWYFGPSSGPDYSVSGLHERYFRSRTDRYWLQQWAIQLGRRGWSIGKGKTWLGGAGNDGIYGPEYRALAIAFQDDQGLRQDGLIGKNTWDAAYHNPVR
ncbi:peptidoglycan recognition protein family protein [Micromonospora aurantiaca (nom. illeg.)]|uniref:peptidoglycan recognition protein family protein n=1 Tax=Micromonospora aurantiaca (nom. illeg.) TaxID=47850 RepID=UPI00165747A8|nr:peptidoglycan-binding domain-containing protein [Micromonospora aurantiaca]MBC9004845.1 peptidoglycan-binding domain-containing protein [Micromonospora aurantiaca]